MLQLRKSALVLVTALAAALLSTPHLAAQSGAVKRGDVNADGAINSIDALAVLASVVGKPLPPEFSLSPYADSDGDNRVTAVDALIVLSYTVGLDVASYPVGLPVVGEMPVPVAIGSTVPAAARSNLAMLYSLVDSTRSTAQRIRISAGADSTTGMVVAANAAGEPLLMSAVQGQGVVVDARSTALAAAGAFFKPPFEVLADSAQVEKALLEGSSFPALVAAINAAASNGQSYLESTVALDLLVAVVVETNAKLGSDNPLPSLADGPSYAVASRSFAQIPVDVTDGSGADFIVYNRSYIPVMVSSINAQSGESLQTRLLKGRSAGWYAQLRGTAAAEPVPIRGQNDGEFRLQVYPSSETWSQMKQQAAADVLAFVFTMAGIKIDKLFLSFIYDLATSYIVAGISPAEKMDRDVAYKAAVEWVVFSSKDITKATLQYLYTRHGVWGAGKILGSAALKNFAGVLGKILVVAELTNFFAERLVFYDHWMKYGSVSAQLTICQLSGAFAECVDRVQITPGAPSLVAGGSVRLAAGVIGVAGSDLSAQRPVTWSSTNSALATVDGSGLVRAGSQTGQVKIAATVAGKRAEVTVTITAPPPASVASVAISPAAPALSVGQSVPLTATLKDANGNPLGGRAVSWSTADPGALSLSSTSGTSATITALAARNGTVRVTATSEGRSGTADVTVQSVEPPPVATISIAPSAPSLAAGASTQLQARVYDSAGNELSGRNIAWTTSNANLLTLAPASGAATTISASSTVTATTTAMVSATSEGKTAQVTVEVVRSQPPGAVASVTVSASPARVSVGSSVSFTATLRDASGNVLTGRTVQWQSGDASKLQLTTWSGTTATGQALAPASAVRVSAASEGVEGSTQVEVVAPSSPPAAPSNLAAQMQTDTLASLTWTDNSSDETEFRIEWKTGTTGTWAHYATVSAGYTLAAATPLRSPNTYYFRVKACNAGACSGTSNEAAVTPPQPVAPCAVPNAAAFFWTENYPDNTRVAAGTVFEKSWTIKNTGTCAWTGTFALRYQSNTRGVISTSQQPVYVQGTIAPQGMFTFRVPMRAPNAAGTYREDWRLTDANGSTVMVHQSPTVWIQIVVP